MGKHHPDASDAPCLNLLPMYLVSLKHQGNTAHHCVIQQVSWDGELGDKGCRLSAANKMPAKLCFTSTVLYVKLAERAVQPPQLQTTIQELQ